jgi:ankyrin repeat protein
LACCRLGNVATLRQLITAKADLDSAPVGCPSPLGQAVGKGNLEVAELLLAAGAKVDTKPWGGESVLWTAAEKGNVDLIKKLIVYGADLNNSPAGSPTALGRPSKRAITLPWKCCLRMAQMQKLNPGEE